MPFTKRATKTFSTNIEQFTFEAENDGVVCVSFKNNGATATAVIEIDSVEKHRQDGPGPDNTLTFPVLINEHVDIKIHYGYILAIETVNL